MAAKAFLQKNSIVLHVAGLAGRGRRFMNFIIREMKPQEYNLLCDFLYEAIFIPEGVKAPDRSIINQPQLMVYISGFGTEKDDLCYVAEVNGEIAGAVWVRDMEDYGHIGTGIPSLAISLYKNYRGYGAGTKLMEKMCKELKLRGYKKVSLSVQKANYAVKMYKKLGFKIIRENEEEYIMVKDI